MNRDADRRLRWPAREGPFRRSFDQLDRSRRCGSAGVPGAAGQNGVYLPGSETPFIFYWRNSQKRTPRHLTYFDGITASFVVDTGTMRCAYGVPFHITQGPPFLGSVGKLSSIFVSGYNTIMWGGDVTH